MSEKLHKQLWKLIMLTMIICFGVGYADNVDSYAATTKAAIPKLSASSLSLAKGGKYQLKLLKANGTIKWSSTNKKIVKVDSKGNLTAVKHGNAKIKAVYKKKTYVCSVKVISLNYTKATINVQKQLSLKVYNGKNTKWYTSNSKIATVSSTGKVKALKSGIVTITCKSNGGKVKCTVFIPKIVAKSGTIEVKKKGTLEVANTGHTCKWSSSLKTVATVDSKGIVTGWKAGVVTITCKTGLATLTYKMKVVDPINIVTSRASLPTPTTRSNLPPSISVKINSYPTERTYTIFRQNSKENMIAEFPSYMSWHGCSAASLTTVLSAYANYKGTPADMIRNVEKSVFGTDTWEKNYDRYSNVAALNSSRPVSLYGMAQILTKKGVKNKYVRSFKLNTAITQIEKHLKTGNPVIFVASAASGKSKKYTNAYHTMVMLGLTDKNQVIIADSADRAKEDFGYDTRIKYSSLKELATFLFSCTNTTSTSKYWNGAAACGGYILVNPK